MQNIIFLFYFALRQLYLFLGTLRIVIFFFALCEDITKVALKQANIYVINLNKYYHDIKKFN